MRRRAQKRKSAPAPRPPAAVDTLDDTIREPLQDPLAPPVQRMFDHKNAAINDLATLNAKLAVLPNVQNFPGGGLKSAHFAGSPAASLIDQAIAQLANKVYDGIDVNDLIQAIDQNLAALPKVFDAKNSATWTPITVATCDPSALLGLQPNWDQALRQGQLVDNSAIGGAVCGVKYHAHTNGGSGGIAFRYVSTGANAVTADVYDYATKRSDNKYHWIKAGKKQSGPP